MVDLPEPTLGSVAAAVRARRSVRAFTSQPVDADLLNGILADALRTPSGGNLQPWHIHVISGEALERLKATVAARAEARSEGARHSAYPASLWDPYRGRRFENGMALYASVGIAREDRAARAVQGAKNQQFFGAPVGLIFTIDQRMNPSQWLDLGMIMQSVMLLATDRGLATCPQASWAQWQQTLTEFLGLEDSDTVAAGMALGYEDVDHPVNSLRATRQYFDEAVSVHRD